jgi:hypothetical protein
MKRIINIISATLVCLFLNQTIATASSHREAPMISYDPLADNTDVYAFKSPTDSNRIVLIANYIPFEHPAGGPNWYTFGENIRYEIHVKNSTTTRASGADITYRFTFRQVYEDSTTFFRIRLGKENWKTFYTLERSVNGGVFVTIVTNGVVPPPNIGPRSIENTTVGLGQPYDTLMRRAITTAVTGERVFAGPIDDPFFVDLGGAFDVGNFRNPGRDGLAKFNCHSLVIEAPISTLHRAGKSLSDRVNILDSSFVIGVWASASRPAISTFDSTGGPGTVSGDFVQVSRLGMPLTNEVIVPIGAKDRWNSVISNSPGEGQFAQFFTNPELALYMDDSKFGPAVPGLADLRIQTRSLGMFDFRNLKPGLFPVKGTAAAEGTAFGSTSPFRDILLPDSMSPRSADLLPIFLTGVPNLRPYQLAVGKNGNPLATGKPFVNNFLPTIGDMLRLNMAVPATPRNSPDFSTLGLVGAAALGLTDARYNTTQALQFIPNMDGFPNGRRLEDDVTRIELQAVGGVVLAAIGLFYDDFTTGGSGVTPQLQRTLAFKAGPTQNDTTFKTVFPFVQTPWRGFIGESYVGPSAPRTLPVSFVKFTAERSGSEVLLTWDVTNEVNNDRYEVEHSLGNGSFKKIGTVSARSGNSNTYRLTDKNPGLSHSNFYRIKQVDNDGKSSFSPVRMVKFESKSLMTITPNPATTFINVYSNEAGLNVNVFDESGKRVASKVVTNGSVQFDISRLAKGIYMVVAERNGVRVETTRIVKQ